MTKIKNALDLPLAEQQRIAKDVFKMSHNEWVATIKRSQKASKKFSDELTAYEREAEEKGIKPNRHMYDRMMSENPPPSADIVVSS